MPTINYSISTVQKALSTHIPVLGYLRPRTEIYLPCSNFEIHYFDI